MISRGQLFEPIPTMQAEVKPALPQPVQELLLRNVPGFTKELLTTNLNGYFKWIISAKIVGSVAYENSGKTKTKLRVFVAGDQLTNANFCKYMQPVLFAHAEATSVGNPFRASKHQLVKFEGVEGVLLELSVDKQFQDLFDSFINVALGTVQDVTVSGSLYEFEVQDERKVGVAFKLCALGGMWLSRE